MERTPKWQGVLTLLVCWAWSIWMIMEGPLSPEVNFLGGLIGLYLGFHVAVEVFTGRAFLVKILATQYKFDRHECADCGHQWKGKATSISYNELQEYLAGGDLDTDVDRASPDNNEAK